MNTPKGVTVELFNGDLQITPSVQGFIGSFNAPDMIEMRITVQQPESGRRFLIATDRNRENASLVIERSVGGKNFFSHTVPIIQAEPGLKFDRDDANKNCVHLIEISADGLVSVVNIAITGQDGEFFLVFHPTYVVQAYNLDGCIAVPTLRIEPGFPALIPFVETYGSRFLGSLPPFSSYEEEGEIKPEIAEAARALPDENHLVVKFWSVRTGTGGALRKRADGSLELVKLYWKNLNVADRCPRHLLEGETIQAKGFRRLHKGRIQFEALNITRVEFEAAAAS
jgi:hypothetical protein